MRLTKKQLRNQLINYLQDSEYKSYLGWCEITNRKPHEINKHAGKHIYATAMFLTHTEAQLKKLRNEIQKETV